MRKMKNSGIEWIGEIPNDWEVKKLKYITCLEIEKVSGENDLPYIGLEHVESKTGKLISEYKPIYDFDGDTIKFNKNNVLFGKLRPYLAKIYYATSEGKCSSEFLVINPINVCGMYLYYLILSKGFIDIVDSSTYGVKMPRAEWGFIGNLKIPIPSVNEQRQISNYLYYKCIELDSVIKAKETTNEKLKEYRQSIIYEAVTKGLNKDASMKDSGIEWIGNTPRGWKLSKIGMYCALKTGSTPPTLQSQYFDGEINWFTPGDFNSSYLLKKSERTLSNLAVVNNIISLYPKHSILLVAIGATVGKIGYIDEDSYSNQQITAIMPQNIYYKYLLYYLIVSSDYIKENALYTTLPIINNTYLKDIPLLVPNNYEERKQIVDYLDKKCAEIDSVITANEKTIEKLKEYRQSVIYEAVTGKTEIL